MPTMTEERTQTTTDTNAPFDQGEVSQLPDLISLGTVSSVEPPTEKQTDKGLSYISQQVKLTAAGAGRNAVAFLKYQPEWLAPGFRTTMFQSLPEKVRAAANFFYHSAIIPPKGVGSDRSGVLQLSALQGLSSTPERFAALARQLKAEEQTADNVYAILKAFLGERNPATGGAYPVGYILRQSYRKDDGGKRYPTDNYEIGAWYYPTSDNLEILGKYVRKDPTKAKFTFEV